jgi:hypothetical protein
MVEKLTRLTHKTAMQLHLVAESWTILSSRARRPVRKLLDTPLYVVCVFCHYIYVCARARAYSICNARTVTNQNYIHE